MHNFQPRRESDPKHITPESEPYLKFIRSKPCCFCLKKSVAHHESITGKGTGKKCSDYETVPLCFECHERRHRIGKYSFWATFFEIPDSRMGKVYMATDFYLVKMMFGFLTEYLERCRK